MFYFVIYYRNIGYDDFNSLLLNTQFLSVIIRPISFVTVTRLDAFTRAIMVVSISSEHSLSSLKPDSRSSYTHLLELNTTCDGHRTSFAIRVFFKYLADEYDVAHSAHIFRFIFHLGKLI